MSVGTIRSVGGWSGAPKKPVRNGGDDGVIADVVGADLIVAHVHVHEPIGQHHLGAFVAVFAHHANRRMAIGPQRRQGGRCYGKAGSGVCGGNGIVLVGKGRCGEGKKREACAE